MKTLLAFLLLCLPLSAAEVTLQWDANPPQDEVTAYCVYEKIDGIWTFAAEVDADVLQVTLTVPAGRHTFALTAKNLWAESARGNEVTTPPLPSAPTGGKVKSVKLALQQSRDMKEWEPVMTAEVVWQERQFFRTVFE